MFLASLVFGYIIHIVMRKKVNRFFIKNNFFIVILVYKTKEKNIDARNYHSPNGTGSSLDLDFMGITIKRLFKKGYTNDN